MLAEAAKIRLNQQQWDSHPRYGNPDRKLMTIKDGIFGLFP
jgi:hypothetical protein